MIRCSTEHDEFMEVVMLAYVCCRFSMQMQETNATLSGRVAALQEEVDALKASAVACSDAWDDRIQTERAQQRKANEEMRVLLQAKLQGAALEKEQARSQLIVLSKQHQLVLADRDLQYKALQTGIDKAEKDMDRTLLHLVDDGCAAVLEVAHILSRSSAVLRKVCLPPFVVHITAASVPESSIHCPRATQLPEPSAQNRRTLTTLNKVQAKQSDESTDCAEPVIMSDLSQEDPRRRLADALSRLKSYASSLCEDCGFTVQMLTSASKKPHSQLLLPDFNDQERTLRSTIDKLVSLYPNRPLRWWASGTCTCQVTCLRLKNQQHLAWVQVQVEQSLESNYTCLSCLSIFCDPVVCVPCGHCCCRACSTQQTCPECQASQVQLVPARNLARLSAKYEFKMQALNQIQTMVEGKIVQI